MALVELIDDHGANAFKLRIALQATKHNTGRDKFDPSTVGDLDVASYSISGRVTHLFAEEPGKTASGTPHRDLARGTDDHTSIEARFKKRRKHSRLTRARRRRKN